MIELGTYTEFSQDIISLSLLSNFAPPGIAWSGVGNQPNYMLCVLMQ